MKKAYPPNEVPAPADRLLDEFQLNEIKRGLKEADRGEFATEEEIEWVARKWTQPDSSKRFPH